MKRVLLVLFVILSIALFVSCDPEASLKDENLTPTNPTESEQDNTGDSTDNPSSEYVIETEVVGGLKIENYFDPVSEKKVKSIQYNAETGKPIQGTFFYLFLVLIP